MKTENNLVMSWLTNSMINEVGENFVRCKTTIKIWDAVLEAFSDQEDTVEAFDIEGILHDLHQEDLFFTW